MPELPEHLRPIDPHSGTSHRVNPPPGPPPKSKQQEREDNRAIAEELRRQEYLRRSTRNEGDLYDPVYHTPASWQDQIVEQLHTLNTQVRWIHWVIFLNVAGAIIVAEIIIAIAVAILKPTP